MVCWGEAAEAEKARASDGAAGNPRPTELQSQPYLPREGVPGGAQRPGTKMGGGI